MNEQIPAKLCVLGTDGDERYTRFAVNLERNHHSLFLERPGMYTEVSCGAAKQHCVVASTEGCSLTFLIKSDSCLGEELQWQITKDCSDAPTVMLSPPQGGYDVSDVRGRSVVCFCGGSGIAGIIPVLKNVCTDALDVKLFYSETAGQYAFNDVIEATRGDVHMFMTEGVLSSNPAEPILGMIAKLANTAPVVFPEQPIVYVCGGKEYTERLKGALVPVLVADEDFRTNF